MISPDTSINLHVLTVGAAEIDQMLVFRDRLRADDADRDAYLQVKRDLAQRTWRHVQHYADSKTAIVQQIMARAPARRVSRTSPASAPGAQQLPSLPWQRYRESAVGAGLKSAGVLAMRAQNAWFWTTRAVPVLLAKATQIGGSRTVHGNAP